MSTTPDMNKRWHDQNIVKVDGRWTVDGCPLSQRETVYQHEPSNIPGMTYIGVKSTFPVKCAIPPHKHGGAAVIGNVIQGSVLNQMICDGETHGPTIHKAGQSWYEPPGCHHVRCENAGNEEAVFVANYIIETKKIEELGAANALVQIDAAEEEKRKEK